jgi:PilZ domain-containing protein
MPERRITSRQKSFLQGRIYYNKRRSSVDCLVRDVSDTGAKLVFGGTVTIPDVVELYLSNKDEVRRAKVQWRKGHEMGVDFADDPADSSAAATGDLIGRVLKLERECAALKRLVNEMRADMRRMSSEPV